MVLTPCGREQLTIQTTCGIAPGSGSDVSYEHILESVEGSLAAPRTDCCAAVLALHLTASLETRGELDSTTW